MDKERLIGSLMIRFLQRDGDEDQFIIKVTNIQQEIDKYFTKLEDLKRYLDEVVLDYD